MTKEILVPKVLWVSWALEDQKVKMVPTVKMDQQDHRDPKEMSAHLVLVVPLATLVPVVRREIREILAPKVEPVSQEIVVPRESRVRQVLGVPLESEDQSVQRVKLEPLELLVEWVSKVPRETRVTPAFLV